MQKSIAGIIALLAGASAVYSQGTVSFANYGALQTYIYVYLGNFRLSPPYNPNLILGGPSTVTTGNPVEDVGNGDDWTVALYGAATGTTPLVQLDTANGTPVTATMETGNRAVDATLGTWYSTEIAVIPGTMAGQSATLQLYAWYNDGGTVTSYAAAVAHPYPAGFSTTATVIVGGPQSDAPPLVAASLPTFAPGGQEFEFSSGLIPEPSTFALGLVGATAVFLRLRKKLPL